MTSRMIDILVAELRGALARKDLNRIGNLVDFLVGEISLTKNGQEEKMIIPYLNHPEFSGIMKEKIMTLDTLNTVGYRLCPDDLREVRVSKEKGICEIYKIPRIWVKAYINNIKKDGFISFE